MNFIHGIVAKVIQLRPLIYSFFIINEVSSACLSIIYWYSWKVIVIFLHLETPWEESTKVVLEDIVFLYGAILIPRARTNNKFHQGKWLKRSWTVGMKWRYKYTLLQSSKMEIIVDHQFRNAQYLYLIIL